MKKVVLKVIGAFTLAVFAFTPIVTAAGPGGGIGGGGGSMPCGWTTFLEPCDATGATDRVKCEASWGGDSTCTLENCDGTEIELGAPTSASCGNGGI